jgi:hypothetical protein
MACCVTSVLSNPRSRAAVDHELPSCELTVGAHQDPFLLMMRCTSAATAKRVRSNGDALGDSAMYSWRCEAYALPGRPDAFPAKQTSESPTDPRGPLEGYTQQTWQVNFCATRMQHRSSSAYNRHAESRQKAESRCAPVSGRVPRQSVFTSSAGPDLGHRLRQPKVRDLTVPARPVQQLVQTASYVRRAPDHDVRRLQIPVNNHGMTGSGDAIPRAKSIALPLCRRSGVEQID